MELIRRQVIKVRIRWYSIPSRCYIRQAQEARRWDEVNMLDEDYLGELQQEMNTGTVRTYSQLRIPSIIA